MDWMYIDLNPNGWIKNSLVH